MSRIPSSASQKRGEPRADRGSRRTRGPYLRALLLTAAAVVMSGVAACSRSPDSHADLHVRELSSPSAPNSGEPHLEAAGDDVLLSWTEPAPEGGHQVMVAALRGDAWTDPVRLVRSDSLFVNWADFPMVASTAPDVLAAHWLVRGPAGGVDYRIEVALSRDGGASWSPPWTPHEDDTRTEHGFVSFFGAPGGGTGVVWLDGRDYANREGGDPDTDGGHGGGEGQMSLRYRSLGPEGRPGQEVLLDARSCDCCQTAAAVTAAGPIVAYRDRSPDEIRDIHVVRWTPDGWTEPMAVHDDGWHIAGCPVNGPAMAARDSRVALAWFTAAQDTPRVKLAFSSDDGVSFAAPVQVDDGHPEGRVDVVLDAEGSAWVSWLERTGQGADVRVRRVRPDGTVAPAVVVAASSESRASGFPRMVEDPSGGIVIAWTDPREPARVRVARLEARTP